MDNCTSGTKLGTADVGSSMGSSWVQGLMVFVSGSVWGLGSRSYLVWKVWKKKFGVWRDARVWVVCIVTVLLLGKCIRVEERGSGEMLQ